LPAPGAGMSASEKYVAAAYLVLFVALLVWVVIIAAKLARLERDVGELAELARRRAEREPEQEREKVSA
jgi:hypothetical protein